MQEDGISYEEVYEAFWLCSEHKGNTVDAIRFEINAEEECRRLWVELNTRTYRPSRSIVFVSEKPVKREIFGAAFRDRVADTIFARRVSPYLEQWYIDDNYSTRVGKGTLYGIRRVEAMIRERSENYTRDCWVMKLDMQSYFMSLPKELAWQKFAALLKRIYKGPDLDLLCWMLRAIIMDRPELNCVRNSRREAWVGMPPGKSLFNSDGLHGLPIGKVVSQMTALVFMDDLDHELTESLWSSAFSYGHYMDDMIFVSTDMRLLEWLRDEVVDRWAVANQVRRHPRKMYLQHYKKGVLFTGGMILPGRVYISRRTIAACVDKIERFNRLAASNERYAERHVEQFVSVMNSYLGMMRHFAAFHQVAKLARRISQEWYQVVYVVLKPKRYKVCIRKPYRRSVRQTMRLEAEMDVLFNKRKTTMTEKEICDRQRENGCSEMYLLQRGNFWRAYDGGAFALARVTGYQVKRLKTIERYQLGFPTVGLARVLERMQQEGMELTHFEQDESLIAFRGGDPAVDEDMAMGSLEKTERLADTSADYRELCSVRKELLGINLADESMTLAELQGIVRNLQVRCLSHLPLS